MRLRDFGKSRDLTFDVLGNWEAYSQETRDRFVIVFNEIKRQTILMQEMKILADKGYLATEGDIEDHNRAIRDNFITLKLLETGLDIKLMSRKELERKIMESLREENEKKKDTETTDVSYIS